METPNGAEILEILLRLYEKQEGVRIKYVIEGCEERTEGDKARD